MLILWRIRAQLPIFKHHTEKKPIIRYIPIKWWSEKLHRKGFDQEKSKMDIKIKKIWKQKNNWFNIKSFKIYCLTTRR